MVKKNGGFLFVQNAPSQRCTSVIFDLRAKILRVLCYLLFYLPKLVFFTNIVHSFFVEGMHQHIKHLRSCDDLLLVIASSDGKLQPSSTKKRSNTYAKNEVGLTKGSPPVNLCGRHMQNPAIRSTPTLMPNTPTNDDNENPWENIFEKPQSCMDKFMRGIKQNFQATCMFG